MDESVFSVNVVVDSVEIELGETFVDTDVPDTLEAVLVTVVVVGTAETVDFEVDILFSKR